AGRGAGAGPVGWGGWPERKWGLHGNVEGRRWTKHRSSEGENEHMMITHAAGETASHARTKTIVPGEYAGAAAERDASRAVGERHGMSVIENDAHAAGTHYKGRHVGWQGTAIFSFHAIKNMTCAEGGLIVTDDDELASRIRSLKFHG
ncbi:hypothetical protein G6X41_10565, partial [Staphylococcus aureus]|nr:hypothetical protein [Staphylococcus aureus]